MRGCGVPLDTEPEQPNSTSSTGSADLNQYTVGSVAAGAVTSNTAAQSNDADSTALTGSTTHNGTTGNTVDPDLTGVTVITSANTVNYVFNKNIGGVSVGAGQGFFIINSAGQVCRQTNPLAISFSANVVTVVFPTGPNADCPAFTSFPKSTTAAVRAGLDRPRSPTRDRRRVPQHRRANGDRAGHLRYDRSGRSDLGRRLGDGNHISYTFDKPIGSVTDSASSLAILPTARRKAVHGYADDRNTATTGTVTVSFASGSQFNEYDVKA